MPALKQCVYCGSAFKALSNNTNPDWQKYCTRKCWTDCYKKSGVKQTTEFRVKHKESTYRWRAKVKQRKIEAKEHKRQKIANIFKRGLRQDRYGSF